MMARPPNTEHLVVFFPLLSLMPFKKKITVQYLRRDGQSQNMCMRFTRDMADDTLS